MLVRQGQSKADEARRAVFEATSSWETTFAPEVVFAFASTKQTPAGVAAVLAERFPKSIVVGCTTAGEHVGGEHLNESLVVAAIAESGFVWSTAVASELSSFDADAARTVANDLFRNAGIDVETFDPADCFCITFIDGLRSMEESVAALVADALQGVRLLGGSAGDDLAFQRTHVFADGKALTDAAVFLLGRGQARAFRIFKHQHFETTPRQLAVTKVDALRRRVLEIDGVPAVEAYARALGLSVGDVTNDVTMTHPLTFSCNREIYVRAVQAVGEDGSLSFYCAVDEGMVLEVGSHLDLVAALHEEMRSEVAKEGPFEFLLVCNCILRALEAKTKNQAGEVAEIWAKSSGVTVGFDTYGEQLDGLHISQTLVAIGLRKAA